MYSKCGRMDEARKAFGGMLSGFSAPRRTALSETQFLLGNTCRASSLSLLSKYSCGSELRDPAKADEVEPVSFLKSEAHVATSGSGGGGGGGDGGGGNMQNMPPYNGGDRGPGGGGGNPPYNRPPAPRGTGPYLEPPHNAPPGPGYGYPPGNVPPGNTPGYAGGNFPQGPAQNFPPRGYGGYRPGYNMRPGGPGGAGPPPPGGYRPPYGGFPGSGNMHRPPPGPPHGGPPQPPHNAGPPQAVPPGGPPQPPYNAGPPQPPYNAGGANPPPYGVPQRGAAPWGGYRPPSGPPPPVQDNRGQRSSGGNFAGGMGPGFQGNFPGVQRSSGGGVGTLPPPRSPPSWSPPRAPLPGPSSPPGAPVPSFTLPPPSPQTGAGMRTPSVSSPPPASPPAAGVSLGRGDASSTVEEKARPSSPTIAGGGTVATPAVEQIAPRETFVASELRKQGSERYSRDEPVCTELQAIACAMNHTEPGTTIRIVKDSRVCDDCHEIVCKLSKIEKRKFICRDNNTLHVYENGECSCGNYW